MDKQRIIVCGIFVVTLAMCVMISGCVGSGITNSSGSNVNNQTTSNSSAAKLTVITSFRPFTLLVAPIGGDDINIVQILPPGADPHDYEPTPSDALALLSGRIFFYDGPFLEPWASTLAASTNPNITLISFADSVPQSAIEQMESEYPNFPNTIQDPHLWLSPQLAEYFVPYAANQLSEADPAHASDYQANAAVFEKKLEGLDAEYKTGLENCTTRTVLTSHAFLDYVAAAYNLTVISIAGLSPDAEPSIRQMDTVLNQSKAAGVRGVLMEPDETQQLSQSVASQLNLPVYSFNTMEILPYGNQTANESDYITIQESNLHEMELALGCH